MDTLFPCLLPQIFVKFVTQGQFWILLVLRIPKHLHAQFDEDLRQQTGKQGVHFLMTSSVCMYL